MSIIFGYINLNGKPVERGTLETMQHAMDFWHPDGSGLWLEGSCGLGNLLLYNTPEALYEKLPMTDSSGNLVMTAGARIDNRDELFRIFDVPLGERLTIPDGKLMLMAYEKWGEACANHLVGDWAMAVWDKRAQKLFLARDHHGITAMYYYKGDDFFVFSSSLKGILCLTRVPKKINEYKIAQLLVNWNEGGPQTCYLDIMRLPPAHTLTLNDGKFTTNRYWYLEHTPEVRLKTDQEYVDMFLELYTEAVRCRLRSYRPVGATLSSGLDSGSVCILAARELAKEGKRLQAYTAVPLYDITGLVPKNRIGDEGPYAQALADKLGNIDVTLCKAEDINPLEGIERALIIHDQLGFAVGNAYWLIELLAKCQNDGLGTLLIGQGGNDTISWPSNALSRNDFSTQMIRRLVGIKKVLDFLIGNWQRNLILNKEFINKLHLRKILMENMLLPYFSSKQYLYTSRIQLMIANKSIAGDLWFEKGLFFKIEIKDPTMDLQLLKFLFGINSESKFYGNRDLLKLNFKDVFPQSIIEGTKRGLQASDGMRRMNDLENKILFGNILEMIKTVSNKKVYRILRKKHKNKADYQKLLKIYSIKQFVSQL